MILLSGCQRRELTYDYEEGVAFRLEIDWSALKAGEEQPTHVKAIFFPVDGGKVEERYVNPEGGEIKVPAGTYNIIVYTWRTNTEGQTVQFRGDSYETFEAYTEEKHQRLPVQRSETSVVVVPQPDAFYAWNSTSEPVEISYSKGLVQKNKTATVNTLNAIMKSMVQEYEFEINVRKAEDIRTMYVVLTEVFGSLPLGEGLPRIDHYGLLVQDVLRVGDIGEITTYRCKAATFGFHDTDKSFIINMTHTTGSGQQEIIDITEPIDERGSGTTPFEKPIVVASKEDPVIVDKKEGDSGGFVPPTLGDWDEKDENIEL